ncbi:MAG: hypothetical protein ACFCU2_05060 [Acidimicrobiia bacterium]
MRWDLVSNQWFAQSPNRVAARSGFTHSALCFWASTWIKNFSASTLRGKTFDRSRPLGSI